MNVFKRKLYSKMLRWKQRSGGTTALLIKGARRVGKSTLVAEFARREYDSSITVDFTNCKAEVRELFNDISDLDYLFMRLQIAYNAKLHPRKSVIVFDEIQQCPPARQAIKHLVADGRYDYIETGSLLSIRQNVKDIVIPSEERELCLYPLDYEEFRWAMGDDVSVSLLGDLFANRRGMGDVGNRSAMRDFRLYMLVGGMPQAVNAYLTTKDMSEVDEVKRSIISLYESDFIKIDPSGNVSKLFHNIPSALTRNASRYMVGSAVSGARRTRMAEAISDLQDSMVVNVAHHANDPGVGMALHCDTDRYKMYVCDTGLFVTLAFWDKQFTDNIIYQKLWSDKLGTDLGYLYENVVAQTLKSAGHELYYYTFPTESGRHNYEIDFLIAEADKISPIEVKSSGYKVHASLDAFCEKFSSRIKNKYLVYTKDLRKQADVLYLPFYMAQFL
jgi:predicted AAA+ superfamily ATPase